MYVRSVSDQGRGCVWGRDAGQGRERVPFVVRGTISRETDDGTGRRQDAGDAILAPLLEVLIQKGNGADSLSRDIAGPYNVCSRLGNATRKGGNLTALPRLLS